MLAIVRLHLKCYWSREESYRNLRTRADVDVDDAEAARCNRFDFDTKQEWQEKTDRRGQKEGGRERHAERLTSHNRRRRKRWPTARRAQLAHGLSNNSTIQRVSPYKPRSSLFSELLISFFRGARKFFRRARKFFRAAHSDTDRNIRLWSRSEFTEHASVCSLFLSC